jgi:hypothetical protein
MSGFYVGQRVRILRSPGWPALAGQVGIIAAKASTRGVQGKSEWVVAPDVWGTPMAPIKGTHGANRFCPNSDQLEPITPPHVAGSWEAIEKLLPNIRERVTA